ncbi:hypothetical protein G5714_000792 [Onychostoma macrolepis]|uniref:Uncharacterized protein n=1 Tax=Onychostoma macrolepis TaxID=369639 RepID=A0A7J6DI13_9TELE|nr:hypothetical protein G5714_000792 [Onychostoma macrolepis]
MRRWIIVRLKIDTAEQCDEDPLLPHLQKLDGFTLQAGVFSTPSDVQQSLHLPENTTYNSWSHRARKLSILQPGDQVWISDAKESGTVVASHSAPRSYLVDTQQGTVRLNCHHLVQMQAEAMEDNSGTPDQLSVATSESLPITQVSEKQDIPDLISTPRTKYGRRIVKTVRLNL